MNVGDKVKHKRYKHYGIGEVREISSSGKRVYVRWPEERNSFGIIKMCGFSAYYTFEKLEKADSDK